VDYTYPMSRGLGATQRAILDALGEVPWSLTVVQLADQLHRSPAQIRRAVHALAERDLVILRKGHGGFAGEGQYGPLAQRGVTRGDEDAEWPTAETRQRPDVYFDPEDAGTPRMRVRWYDVEYVRIGMPTGLSLLVSLPRD